MSHSPKEKRMPDELLIEDIDRDGAVAEATAELSTTRSGLLRRVGLVAGGGLVAGLVPMALSRAQSGTSKNDVKILNYALTLEYLESAFYAEALSKGKLNGSVQNFATVVAAHEATHVSALEKALGSAAVKKPKFDFKGTTGSQKMFLSTSKTLEDTGVSAYQGQADKIDSKAILATAGSILAVEARHAAWVRDLIAAGKTPLPAPDAFSPPLTMKAVLAAVGATGFIKS
jgi:rubrerythrin